MVETLPFQKAIKEIRFPGLERNLFCSADWMAVLDATYRLNLFVKFIREAGEVRSYVVYTAVRNFLEWKICVCSYCDYCDGHVKNLDDWKAFFEDFRREYPAYRIAVRNLRDPFVSQVPEFQLLSKECFHVLDTRPDLELVWKKTDDSFRAAVRQAERNGVTVRPAEHKQLEDFYRMHLRVRKHKHRVFPQPYRFFENIWQQYVARDRGVLLGAFSPDGEIIAANMYLICGDTLYYKFNTSSLPALKLRANNFLFWEGIKLAKARGLQWIDLGSSGLEQEGLILFKNHTGAARQEIRHYGYAPPGYKFSQKRILRWYTALCTHPWMPEAALRWGSSLIYPYLA